MIPPAFKYTYDNKSKAQKSKEYRAAFAACFPSLVTKK